MNKKPTQEQEDFHSISSPSFSSSSSSTLKLQSSINIWTQVTRRNPNVKIIVQGVCFNLHKEAVTSKSGYLKRQLNGLLSELTLSPPLKLTAQAFSLFVQFCYQCDVVFTPFNLAELLLAVALLDVAADSLLRVKAEAYFSRVVALDGELLASVLLEALSLMPEVEEAVALPSRCIEALYSLGEEEDGGDRCADCLKEVSPGEFMVVVESMQRRLDRSHDLLYEIIDLYLKVYDGNISEEQKIKICNSIDCNMLSSQILMQSVQNPRMPLRFVVQAMLMEQLNTHRSVSNAITSSRLLTQHEQISYQMVDNEILPSEANTLSVFLQRDAAFQQVSELKAAIDTTASRIQSLENELTNMRSKLTETKKNVSNTKLEFCGRSISCRFSTKEVSKVERGERGSISSSNLHFKVLPPCNDQEDLVHERSSSKTKKNVLQWLIKGVKSAFRVPMSGSKKDQSKAESNRDKSALVPLTCKDENNELEDGADMAEDQHALVATVK